MKLGFPGHAGIWGEALKEILLGRYWDASSTSPRCPRSPRFLQLLILLKSHQDNQAIVKISYTKVPEGTVADIYSDLRTSCQLGI